MTNPGSPFMWAVSRQVYATQWTGSNEADVLTVVQTITPVSGNTWTIDSVDPGVMLYLRETGPGGTGLWPVAINQVCIVAPDFGILERVSLAGFQARYRVVADTFEAALAASPTVDAMEAATAAAQSTAITAAATAVSAQSAATAAGTAASAAQAAANNAAAAAAGAKYSGFGAAALPTLLPNQSTNVVVTVLPTQPGTNYVARAVAFSGVAVLTNVTINGITINSAGQVTVSVTNSGIASIAGIILVHVSPVVP